MDKIVLKLRGKLIKADVIDFSDRLKYGEMLTYEDADDDWEILSVKGTKFYVAYQQCSAYDRV